MDRPYENKDDPSPISQDTFLVDGIGSVEIRFSSSQDGGVTRLVLLGPAGPEDESPRDPSSSELRR